jgi:hypothetical protein
MYLPNLPLRSTIADPSTGHTMSSATSLTGSPSSFSRDAKSQSG